MSPSRGKSCNTLQASGLVRLHACKPALTPSATAPMQLFNSPQGRFVRHLWGGPGRELRKHVFDDELRVQGVWKRAQYDRLLAAAKRTWMGVEC